MRHSPITCWNSTSISEAIDGVDETLDVDHDLSEPTDGIDGPLNIDHDLGAMPTKTEIRTGYDYAYLVKTSKT